LKKCHQVNHFGPWDIKIPESWNNTIAMNTFPGETTQFYFHELLMTPEQLGNYTYGYIGAAFGIPLPILICGYIYAADLGNLNEVTNEFNDWPYIQYGVKKYRTRWLK